MVAQLSIPEDPGKQVHMLMNGPLRLLPARWLSACGSAVRHMRLSSSTDRQQRWWSFQGLDTVQEAEQSLDDLLFLEQPKRGAGLFLLRQDRDTLPAVQVAPPVAAELHFRALFNWTVWQEVELQG